MSSILLTLQDKLQDPAIPWQKVLLGAVVAVAFFEQFVDSRQKPYLNPILHPQLPAALRPYLTSENTHETYTKSQAYARHKLTFSSITTLIEVVETYVLLTSISAPLFKVLFPSLAAEASASEWTLLKGFWDLAAELPGGTGGEIRQSVAFAGLLTAIGAVMGVPVALYKNFVLEEKHGFNKMTYGLYVKDWIKNLGISLALELPLLAGLVKIIHYAGQDAILQIVTWTIVFIACVQVLMVFIFPAVIQPMFNTFTLLPEDSPVFPRVKALAEKLNFPLGKVWVINGSLRSSHSNAYFYGLPGFNKNIVIYDTLLEKSTPEEVEAILAHELGHWAGLHTPVLLVTALTQVAFSLTIYTIFLSNSSFLSSFGFSSSSLSQKLYHSLASSSSSTSSTGPTIVALLLASTLFSPLSALMRFGTNAITRHLEYDADAFAVKLGEEYAKNLKGALVGIHEKNLAVYGIDPVYSAYNNSHPTLLERLQALDAKIDSKKNE
ncbi:hypothetical protein JCM11641_004164 [Rhodosporidiobolus odoratus]